MSSHELFNINNDTIRVPQKLPDEGEVKAVIFFNMFDLKDRQIIDLEWGVERTLDAYLDGLPSDVDWVVTVNAEIFEEHQWADVRLKPGDVIAAMLLPRGGDGSSTGKHILRLAAILLVAWLTFGAASPFASFFAGLGEAATFAQMTAFAVGSTIVNAAIPPPSPNGNGLEFDESPSYGVDGPKNTVREGTPVPVVFGEVRMGGNLVQINTETVTPKLQDIELAFVLSEGPIESITNIEINDQDIANFDNTNTQTRLGTASDAKIPWMPGPVIERSVNVRLDDSWYTFTTPGSCERFRIDITCPVGFGKTEKDGDFVGKRKDLEVQYSVKDANNWQTVQSERYLPGLEGGTWEQVPYLTIDARTKVAYRQSWTIPFNDGAGSGSLALNQYDIRIRRTVAENMGSAHLDQIWWTSVQEILTHEVDYNYTAMTAVRLRATDQITGIPKVTSLVKGVKLDQYDDEGNFVQNAWTDNPAWIALSILKDRWGGNLPIARFDLAAFKEWADYCTTKSFVFNMVFDYETNAWDALKLVLRVGHAQLVPRGNKFSVVVEKADTPILMFGMGNIIEGTFATEWLPLEDRANDYEVTFLDKDDNYRERSLKIYDSDAIDNGYAIRSASVALPGVTNYTQASYEVNFLLAMNKHIKQSVSFEAPLEAITCTIGSLIYVQHDIPDWADAGRLENTSTTTTLDLDRPVNMQGGVSTYKVLVHNSARQVAVGNLSNVTGQKLTIDLTGIDESEVRRIVQGGEDLRVTKATQGGSDLTVIVEQGASALTVSSNVEIWTVDELIERDVTAKGSTGDYSQIDLVTPLPETPDDYANWMFGEAATYKKPYRVISISGSGEYTRRISAQEYNGSVYDDPANVIPAPDYPTPLEIGHVTDENGDVGIIGAWEDIISNDTGGVINVHLEWNAPTQGLYEGADIYVAIDGASIYTLIDTVRSGQTSWAGPMEAGQQVYFRVVAFDAFGNKAPFQSAPSINYTVGTTRPYAMPTIKDLRLKGQLAATTAFTTRDIRLEWELETPSDVDPDVSQPSWEDPFFKDYRIQIYDDLDAVVKTYYTTDRAFLYEYEKNVEDGGPYTPLKIGVAMRDTGLNISTEATKTLTNAAPAIVSNLTVDGIDGGISVNFDLPTEVDWENAKIYVASSGASFTPNDATNLKATGRANQFLITDGLSGGTTYYVKVGITDHYNQDDTDINTTASGVSGVPLSNSADVQDIKDHLDDPETGYNAGNTALATVKDTVEHSTHGNTALAQRSTDLQVNLQSAGGENWVQGVFDEMVSPGTGLSGTLSDLWTSAGITLEDVSADNEDFGWALKQQRRDNYFDKWQPVEAGETIYFRGFCKKVSAPANVWPARFGLNVKHWNGTAWSQSWPTDTANEIDDNVGWVSFSGSITIPANAVMVRPFFQIYDSSGPLGAGSTNDVDTDYVLWAKLYVGRTEPGADITANATAHIDLKTVVETKKTTTYSQGTAPVHNSPDPLVTGDVWFDSSDNYKQYWWNGSDWSTEITPTQITANANSITTLNSQVSDAGTGLIDLVDSIRKGEFQDMFDGSSVELTSNQVHDIQWYIDNNEADTNWFKVLEQPVPTQYDGYSLNASVAWGGNAGQLHSHANVQIKINRNGTATPLGWSTGNVCRYNGMDLSSKLYVYARDNGDDTGTLFIYAKLSNYEAMAINATLIPIQEETFLIDNRQNNTNGISDSTYTTSEPYISYPTPESWVDDLENAVASATAVNDLQTQAGNHDNGVFANATNITDLEARIGSGLINEFVDSEDISIDWRESGNIAAHSTFGPRTGSYHVHIADTVVQWADIWNATLADESDGWPVPKTGEQWTIGFWAKNTDTVARTVGFPGVAGGNGGNALHVTIPANTSSWTWFTQKSDAAGLGAGIDGNRYEFRSALLNSGKVIYIDDIVLVRGRHDLDGTEVLGLSPYAKATQELAVNVSTHDGEIGTLEAKYTVKLNVNDVSTGFTSVTNGDTSSFAVQADKFIIYHTDGTTPGDAPFIVESGVTYIKEANIKELTVDKLLAGSMGVSMQLGSGGQIKMGATNWDDDGVFIGNVSGVYKVSYRNGQHYWRYDGTTVEASGDILARRSTIVKASTNQHIIAQLNAVKKTVTGLTYERACYLHLTRSGDIRIQVEIDNEVGTGTPDVDKEARVQLKQGATVLDTLSVNRGQSYGWGSDFLEATNIDITVGPIEVWLRGSQNTTGGNRWAKLRGIRLLTDEPCVDYFTPSPTEHPDIEPNPTA